MLLQNYEFKKDNKKLIPILLCNDLYQPEGRLKVIKELSDRIEKFKAEHFNNDFDGSVAEELKRMCQILKFLEDFLLFAKDRDKKTRLSGCQKMLKYIYYDRGFEINEIETLWDVNRTVVNQTINVNDGGQMNVAYDSSNINASTIKEN